MFAARQDRLWAAGGALCAVILLVVGWFFVISPQHEQTGSLSGQATQAQDKIPGLRRKLDDLRVQNSKIDEYRAQLIRDRQALPATSGLSDFLREIQSAGTTVGVSVSGLMVGAATQVPAGSSQVFALSVTLTVSGEVGRLGQFLDQLQQVQPRAVLINSVNAVPNGQSESFANGVTLTLAMQVFVSPAAAKAGTPSAAPTAQQPTAEQPSALPTG